MQGCVGDADDVKTAVATLELQSMKIRQGLNAQDPLSSVHHFLVCMHVMLLAVFGIRMCLSCPHCNHDSTDPSTQWYQARDTPCQDLLGNNTKPCGGYGGFAEGLGFSVEFQGDGTPHGHGFVSLVNAYQYGSLDTIANMIENNWRNLQPEEVVQRFTNFMGHMNREDHFNQQEHTQRIWKAWRNNFMRTTRVQKKMCF